jgi:RsiW-degrading membrane proteinase PrsW (M82 family)
MMLTPLVEETLKAAPLLLRPVWKMVTSRTSALWVGFVLGVSFGLGEAAFLAYGIAQAGVYNLSWLLRSSARLLKAKQVERVILIGYHAVLSYPNYITHWEQLD